MEQNRVPQGIPARGGCQGSARRKHCRLCSVGDSSALQGAIGLGGRQRCLTGGGGVVVCSFVGCGIRLVQAENAPACQNGWSVSAPERLFHNLCSFSERADEILLYYCIF